MDKLLKKLGYIKEYKDQNEIKYINKNTRFNGDETIYIYYHTYNYEKIGKYNNVITEEEDIAIHKIIEEIKNKRKKNGTSKSI